MTALFEPLREAATYRSLLFLTAALPLSVVEGALLIAGWTLTAVLLITPAVIAALIGLRAVVGAVAASESAFARELTGAEIGPQRLSSGGRGFWNRGKVVVADASFWRQQAYLLLRVFAGGPLAIVLLSLIASALYLIGLPFYYRWTQADAGLRIDTLQKALLVVPVGLAALVLAAQLIRPLAKVWRRAAEALLRPDDLAAPDAAAVRIVRLKALKAHASATGLAVAIILVVWALTGGPFWPIWPLIALALPLAIHAWVSYVADHPALAPRFGVTDDVAIHAGIATAFSVFFILVWAAAGGGSFWPVWPIVVLGAILTGHVIVTRARLSSREDLEERIENLETTRAGAVDVQETELRRIERDLHDGAQARLVALGMNLGMAEQKLDADPGAARELVNEARAGVEEALRELRRLARGIHPPVLTDRGLEAAISALADHSAIPVTVTADVPERPAASVETAAYFVAAEALTNAAKHGEATRIEVRIVRRPKSLVLEVTADGRGGADPAGSGLTGLRRRVEALDGTLLIVSPSDGGTTLRAELPCES
jgi:signal transduction histidine kinase